MEQVKGRIKQPQNKRTCIVVIKMNIFVHTYNTNKLQQHKQIQINTSKQAHKHTTHKTHTTNGLEGQLTPPLQEAWQGIIAKGTSNNKHNNKYNK
jgi:hypothetical protein